MLNGLICSVKRNGHYIHGIVTFHLDCMANQQQHTKAVHREDSNTGGRTQLDRVQSSPMRTVKQWMIRIFQMKERFKCLKMP